MRSWLQFGVGLALVAACCSTPAVAEDCLEVSMTVTAAVSNDPGFVGLYKYTVTGSWDVGRQGLSHIDFFLALKDLVCRCDPRVVRFGSPAGTSTGETCPIVNYRGEYKCKGDPSIPEELDDVPAVKFEPQGCEVGTSGTGTWYFYSPLPPAPYSVTPDAVAIKHGNTTCTGDLTGTMPSADCSTPAQPTTWGSMKSLYR